MENPHVPRYAGYAFDLDGTVYLGAELIPGADATLMRLREQGSRVVFVTNKPIERNADYVRKLNHLGIVAEPEDVVSATDALVLYLQRYASGSSLLLVAEAPVQEAVEAVGFNVVSSPAQADVVVVSFDRAFNYRKLDQAYRAVKLHGARIIATNPDPYCPTPDGGLPDCAAMLAALEACTELKAEAVVGKPSTHMADAFLNRLGLPPEDALMVGDRLSTDVAMGAAVGMPSALVLSGATTLEDLERAAIRPTHVLKDLNALAV